MNKILCTFILICAFYAQNTAQSQLTNLNKIQAESAVRYLKTQQEIILYSGCEINDVARKINLSKVWYEPSPDDVSHYNLKITGKIMATFKIKHQEPINYKIKTEPELLNNLLVDLSIVHVATGGYTNDKGQYIWDATCLGIYLGFPCDPCVDPFDYPEEIKRGR